MTLEQPELGSDPPNGSGQERGATVPTLMEHIENLMNSPVQR